MLPSVPARTGAALLLAALALSACGGGGPTPAATPDGGPAEPIVAPPETWTWVDFPDSACGNGTPTGIGINPTARSSDVLVYLNGGGACWDALTCVILRTAVNLDTGYGAAAFEADAVKSEQMFNRQDQANPFRDASYVDVPYCTGDLHAGTRLATYEAFGQAKTVLHVGARNLDAFLRRLTLTFPGPRRIFLAGSSAGAYGAQLTYPRFAAAFAEADVHLLSDSGQLVQPWGGRVGEMRAAWAPQVPEACPACADDFPSWVGHLATAWPTRRFALLAYDEDQTLTLYFGYPLDGSFKAATDALLAQQYDPAHPNARYLVLPGTNHCMLGDLTVLDGPQGVPVRTWVSEWMTGGAGWVNLR